MSDRVSFVDSSLARLERRFDTLRDAWMSTRPFRWIVADDFLPTELAESILAEFPSPEDPVWSGHAYVHQRRKLTATSGFGPTTTAFFDLTEDPRFIQWMERLTGIDALLADPALVGGGLHCSLDGGFLDVHVDYNRHPETKLHRRLNLLLFMNKAWQPDYEGYLELWDLKGGRRRLTEIAPLFNRAVIFETNDRSYHGHPVPLLLPDGYSRKSLAVYYFSEHRDDLPEQYEANTQYRTVGGLPGYLKVAQSAMRTVRDRLGSDGIVTTGIRMAEKVVRRMAGLPPKNG